MATYDTSTMARFQLAVGRNPDIAAQIKPKNDEQRRQLEKLTDPAVQEMIALAIEGGEDMETILRKIDMQRTGSQDRTVVDNPYWFEEEHQNPMPNYSNSRFVGGHVTTIRGLLNLRTQKNYKGPLI